MKGDLITVATFQYSAEAEIIKGRLESEKIEVLVFDNLTIDADPLVSQAIGGVKLKVWESDKEKALKVLESIDTYSKNDEGEVINCPNCNSTKVEYFTSINDAKSFFSFVISILFWVLPFYVKYSYRCENCKTKFNLD